MKLPIDTFNTIVWLSYARPLRSFREMKDRAERIAYFARLTDMGVKGLDYAIMVDRMNPSDAMQIRIECGVTQPGIIPSLDPADYPRAKDLIVTEQPFDFPNHQGDPTGKERDAIGTTFRPLLSDKSDIGALYMGFGMTAPNIASSKSYEKVLQAAEGGLDPEFTSDWSEDGDFVATWLRIG
jgi:hypothetical protein